MDGTLVLVRMCRIVVPVSLLWGKHFRKNDVVAYEGLNVNDL